MIVQHLIVAFALLLSEGNLAFPHGAITVLEVKHNILNGPSKHIHLNKTVQQRIAQVLEEGTSEVGVFFADYTITIMYQHKTESVLVNGKYFKLRGRTYVMKDDLGKILSAISDAP